MGNENNKKLISKAFVFLTFSLIFTGCAFGNGKNPGTPSTPTGDPVSPSAVVSPTGTVLSDSDYPVFSHTELFENDMLLYFADCGSTETRTTGLYQSVSDMNFGKDPKTGITWGFKPDKTVIVETDSTGEGVTAVSRKVDPETDSWTEESGICYSFGVPSGTYRIICGFFNPFSVRKIDILAEGEQLVSQEKIFKYTTTELTCEQKVTDGMLDIRVTNLKRGKDKMQSPMLTYIRIEAVPEYDREWLEIYADHLLYREEMEDVYTAATLEPLKTVTAETKKILSEQSKDADYRELCMQLKEAYNNLEMKIIYSSFLPGEVWLDTEATPIQAHGGQIQRLTVPDRETGESVEKWWWIGEDKTKGYRGGINAYSSDDLYNWTFEGTVMRNVSSREQLNTEQYFKDLYADYTSEQLDNVYLCINDSTSVIERPKLIYNEKTKKYIIWFHADGPTATSNSNYAAASAGVAISDSPYGPFKFIDRYRLNVCPDDQHDYHPSSKGMARDMNLFIDDDGTAYIIYASEENLTLYLSKLNDEFTGLATAPENAVYGRDFIRIFPGAQREGPALFKRNGKYYLMTSACTGWDPNQAGYAMADSLFGEWVNMGDPCIGDTTKTTFHSQSTCIFCADENNDMYIYMGDRWNSDELNDSRYVWLPIEFDNEGKMSISFVSEWKK